MNYYFVYLTPKQKLQYQYFYDLANEPDYFYSKIIRKTESKKSKITYDFTLPETHQFWSNGFVSHNSGKSIASSFYATYLIHLFLKLQKPADLFLGVPNQFLVGTVVAP